MDSPPSSSSSLAQLTSKSNIQQHHNTSTQFQMQPGIRKHHNTSGQFQMQSTVEMPCIKSEQSQRQPETTCVAALEAKISFLQTELDLLEFTKSHDKQNIYNLMYENKILTVELVKARECIDIMMKYATGRNQENAKLRCALGIKEEKEIDRKGKKVAEIDEIGEKRKVRSMICITRNGAFEVDVLPSSEDSGDSDEEEELTNVEEEDVAQLKTFLKMARSEGLGSCSKTGSRSVEVGDTIRPKAGMDCGLSNGEVEKLSMLDEITSPGPNYKEGSKLAMSGEIGSSFLSNGAATRSNEI